jgi:hypothetical protein
MVCGLCQSRGNPSCSREFLAVFWKVDGELSQGLGHTVLPDSISMQWAFVLGSSCISLKYKTQLNPFFPQRRKDYDKKQCDSPIDTVDNDLSHR